jgi:hypothetical protein
VRFVLLNLCFSVYLFVDFVCTFSYGHFIVLSVLLFMASDYHFVILRLFCVHLHKVHTMTDLLSFCVGHGLSFFFLTTVLSDLLLYMASNYSFGIFKPVKLTQWQIYLKYLCMYLSIALSLPWNSIHSDGFRIFPVHKVLTPNGMLLQLTIWSSIVARCPDLDAQHLWASNHVSPSLKKV